MKVREGIIRYKGQGKSKTNRDNERKTRIMTLSDRIAKQIFDLLEKSDGETEIQRNNLAALIGCVPSQINYVIASRFTACASLPARVR